MLLLLGLLVSAPAQAAIQISLVPARTSGVAPLAVFFDATGTTDSSETSSPFHDLDYAWNFGDPGAGTWAYGSGNSVDSCGGGMGGQQSYCGAIWNTSKNLAYGATAAHVFEAPGNYLVTLTVTGPSGPVSTQTTITVQDPAIIFGGVWSGTT